MSLLSRNFGAVTVVAAVLLLAGGAHANIEDDIHVSNDEDAIRLDIDSRTFEEVKSFFDQGYPPASVMLHAVSLGMSINDAVYLAVLADLERAPEFYDTAVSLLPSLPGWACHDMRSDSQRYVRGYDAEELGETPSLAEVLRRYVENNERLVPFPDWSAGKVHFNASTSELAGLIKEGEFWYRPSEFSADSKPSVPVRSIVFVTMHADTEEIIIDNEELVRGAQQRGIQSLGVVVIYAEDNQQEVSRFGDEPSITDIATAFFGDDTELLPTVSWEIGEYHTKNTIEEIADLFDLPSRDEVGEARWAELEADLQENGFARTPLLLTLLNNTESLWIDDPARVAVAQSLGLETANVAYFYHSLTRLPCGQSALNCRERICEAAVAAGADESICTRDGQRGQSVIPPGSEGGVPSPS